MEAIARVRGRRGEGGRERGGVLDLGIGSILEDKKKGGGVSRGNGRPACAV